MKIYKFRNCLLNTLERRVIRNGDYLELTPKMFDILQLLVERSGSIVSKDEILGIVWSGSFVEEGNLCVHVSKLRQLLDTKSGDRFIETAHGCGYRFGCTVQPVTENEWERRISCNDYAAIETKLGGGRLENTILIKS